MDSISTAHKRTWPSSTCRRPLIRSGPLRFEFNASSIDMPRPTPLMGPDATAPSSSLHAAATTPTITRVVRRNSVLLILSLQAWASPKSLARVSEVNHLRPLLAGVLWISLGLMFLACCHELGRVAKLPFLSAQLTFPFAYRTGCCLNEPMVGALCSGHGVPPLALQGQVSPRASLVLFC